MKSFSNWKILLLGIVILAAFFRFYQLGTIPAGLTNDEADIGYDAYSIYNTGRDQWGQLFPLISFKGFGDYRPPAYTYLVTPLIPLFGLTPLAVRLPSALFGIVAVILLFFILKKLFSEKTGLIGSLLFAISPWSIGLSRIGIESNVAVTLLLTAILFFINSQKKIKHFYLAIFFFASTLYTYAGYTLLTPLVLFTLLFVYRKSFKKKTRQIVIGLAIFILLCLPLFIQQDASAKIRFSQVNFLQNINSIGIINTINDQRGVCIKTLPSAVCKVIYNKVTAFGSSFIGNYLSHFSVSFLFISGTESQYSILPQRGLLYIFEFFLLISGFVWIIKKKQREGYLLVWLLLLSPLPDTITGGGNYSRSFVMLPFLLSIEALGFVHLLSFFENKKAAFLKPGFITLSILIAAGSTVMFFITYTTYFKVFNSRFSSYGYEELMKYVSSIKNDYSKIYISRHLNDTKHYIYYLYYNKYDPVKFQQKKDIAFTQDNDGWISIDRIKNIYFVTKLPKFNPNSPLVKENILLISAPVDFSKESKPQKYIRDLKNDALFEAVTLQEYLKYQAKPSK